MEHSSKAPTREVGAGSELSDEEVARSNNLALPVPSQARMPWFCCIPPGPPDQVQP